MVDIATNPNVDANLEEASENTNLPTVRAAMAVGVSAGEVDVTDLKIPYLSIAYGVGKLAEKFNPGDLVIGGEHLIAKKNEKIKLVILSDVTYWKERLSQQDYANGMRPRSFLTKEEVLAEGGTVDWVQTDRGRVAPTFGKAMDLKILIQKPDHLEAGIFGIEIEDKKYTPAYFSVDKSAFTRVGKEIITSKSLYLAGKSVMHGVWQLWTETQSINGNPTVVPMIRLDGNTSDPFRETVMGLFG